MPKREAPGLRKKKTMTKDGVIRESRKDVNRFEDQRDGYLAMTRENGKRNRQELVFRETTAERLDLIGNAVASGVEDLIILTNRGKVTIWDTEEIKKRCFEYLERKINEKALPTMEGLAVNLGVAAHTLKTWEKSKENPEVSEILETMRNVISSMYADSAMRGALNPVQWIFYAKNHFGYTDKTETEITTKADIRTEKDVEEIRKRWMLESENSADSENGKDVNQNGIDAEYEVK